MQKKSKLKTGGKKSSQTNGGVLEEEYVVEKVLDRKIQNGKAMYLIKWANYPMSQNTWEPLSHLTNVIDLVEAYDTVHPDTTLSAKTTPPSEQKVADDEKKAAAKKRKKPIESSVQQLEKEAKALEELHTDKSKGKREGSAGLHGSLYCGSEKGSFEKDLPVTVIGARKEGENIICTVSWHRRMDGVLPDNTEFTNNELRDKCPHILLDFYESKIKFLPGKEAPAQHS